MCVFMCVCVCVLTCAQETDSAQQEDTQPGRAAEEKSRTTAALPEHSGPV